MFRMRIGMRFVAAAAIFALPALSQPDMERSRHEVSGQALGSFVKKTTDEGIENKATHSGGVLGSYRFYFSSRHGVEATYGYAQNTHELRSKFRQAWSQNPLARGLRSIFRPVSIGQIHAVRFGRRRRAGFRSEGQRHRRKANTRRLRIWRWRGFQFLKAHLCTGPVSRSGLQFADLRSIGALERRSDNTSGAAVSRVRLSLLKSGPPRQLRRSGRNTAFVLVACK